MVITLDYLRTEIIVGIFRIIPVLLEEFKVITSKPVCFPCEYFGADVRGGAGIGFVAARGELKTVIDILLYLESLPAEDEVAADEAG